MGILRAFRERVGPAIFQQTRVARYAVLPASVGGVTAPGPGTIGSQWAPHFDLPGLVTGTFSVLFFEARAHEPGARLSVHLSRPNEQLLRHAFDGTDERAFRVVIRPGMLVATGNELLLTAHDGPAMTFSDAFILYTSDQTTVPQEPVIGGG